MQDPAVTAGNKIAEEETRQPPKLVLVVPCYNEEAILSDTMSTLSAMLEKYISEGLVTQESFICYIDDGSRDSTWELLLERHRMDHRCRAIKFAANAGHQNAVWAGMDQARKWGADCIISLDADLQDDIRAIPEMIGQYMQGCDVVYGIRKSRSTDTAFKRDTARLFYALMTRLRVGIIPDHADYRLVSRPVLKALRGFEEHSLFLRGLFPIIGFKTGKVYYDRLSRKAGESKYPLRKMLSFAWQGLTSCSAAPLRLAGLLSLACMLVALLGFIYTLYKYFAGEVIQGWTSLVIIILFLGSAQLFCLAIMGEYIAKIFTEVRHRPRYIIEKTL